MYSLEPHRAGGANNAKKLAKTKIDFFDLYGVGGAGWRCRSFFLKKKYSYRL
jgi:hypothetical protein